VHQRFGSPRALRSASLAVDAGEVLALLGENGAGKSTLMQILAGALRADGGSMTIRGEAYAPSGTLEARAAGVHAARGEFVAFVADHVYPDPGWAEAVIAAYDEGPWAGVGYSFRNANPDTYASRAAMLADFGPWLAPTRSGETDHLPTNDVSYRRSLLAGFGDELAELLTAEPLLLEQRDELLDQQGYPSGASLHELRKLRQLPHRALERFAQQRLERFKR